MTSPRNKSPKAGDKGPSDDSVELKDLKSNQKSDVFKANARNLLTDLYILIMQSDVSAFGLGEKIIKNNFNMTTRKFEEEVIKTRATKTMKEVYAQIEDALYKDDMATYLENIAKIEAMLNVKITTNNKQSAIIDLYKQLKKQVDIFKDENREVLETEMGYKESLEQSDFSLLQKRDDELGKEYLEYKKALNNLDASMGRINQFLKINKDTLQEDGSMDILVNTIEAILQTCQAEDLKTFHHRINLVITQNSPHLLPPQQTQMLSFVSTLVADYQKVMVGINEQWKDYYIRTSLAVVASIAAPFVGAGAHANAIKDISSITGGLASGGGLAANQLGDGRFRNVSPKAKAEDVVSGLWEKKGSLAATGAESAASLILSVTCPPVAAVFGGVRWVKSIITIGGTAAKEADILFARQSEAVKILGENTKQFTNFRNSQVIAPNAPAVRIVVSENSMFKPAVSANDPSFRAEPQPGDVPSPTKNQPPQKR